MFSQLVDGVRQLRTPLMAGYVLLFTGWLILHDRLPSADELSEPASSVHDLYQSLSSGSQAALWTFIAAMLGSFFDNLVLRRLVAFLVRLGPDWDWFIDEARWAARRYEEYTVKQPNSGSRVVGSTTSSYRVPSASHSLELRSKLEDRERRYGEIKFRVALALMLLFPATYLAIEGNDWIWALTFAPSAVVLLDVVLLHETTIRYMTDAIRKEIRQELDGSKSKLKKLEENAAGLPEAKGKVDEAAVESRRQSAIEEMPPLKARIKELSDAETALGRLRKGRAGRTDLKRIVEETKTSTRESWSRPNRGRF